VTDTDGVEHNLYAYAEAGKHIYLDFFFDSCGPCQTWQPTFNEFYDKYGCNEGDLIMISINNGSDSDAEVIAYENTYGGPFNHSPAVSADGGSAAVDNDFGIGAYPTFILIGPDKTLLENDIWPLTDITTFEATFPAGVDPVIMECFLGLLDAENTSDFLLYPTISNGKNINLRLSNLVDIAVVTVFDVSGKQVFVKEFSTSSLVINLNVNSGTYFVNVKTNSGTTVKKLIVK